MIIGITGKKRHGKDTVAKFLVENRESDAPCIRIAFADALKEEVADMIVDQYDFFNGVQKILFRENILRDMNSDDIDPKTGKAKKEEFRLILQWWGTEFRRNNFGEDYWIRKMAEKITEYEALYKTSAFGSAFHIVIPDVRFLDEAEYVRKIGGQIWKVERAGLESNDTHQSEAELDLIKPDWTILNGYTIDMLKTITLDLYQKVVEKYERK